MIHIFKPCRSVRPNLKLFSRFQECRQISLGKPNKCKNNGKETVPDDIKPNSNEAEPKKSSDNKKKEYPEAPTSCCMSGCANCVWLEYAEKLSEYYKDGGEQAIKEINEKVTDPNMKAFLLFELRMRNIK
ncbi:oxidoreductase-like domain-containing protein 1 [Anoplophora glabripennis]|uniref:oxidoreductase-like domain-containing protein 1 n=1 Tax=Anoplophora glabripennis TaxID=217634 RepID=UPI0008758385|nr:oxidoreductase-like domain-containing protein 1 [Anoplophora glabripennis]